jgi:hypothetical protein
MNMTCLLTFAVLGSFKFPGGTIQDLAHNLASFRGQSCVAEIFDGDQYVQPFHCDGTANALRNVIQKASGYSLNEIDDTLVLTTGFVQPSLFNFRGEKFNSRGQTVSNNMSTVSPVGVDSKYRSLTRLNEKVLRPSDLITIETRSHEFTTLSDLKSAGTFRTNWHADWPFQSIPLALSVHGLSPKALLKAIAHAEGARYTESEKLETLSFSGANYRQRYLHSAEDNILLDYIASTGEAGNLVMARLRFRKEAIKQLSDSFLEQNFADLPLNKSHGRINFDGSNAKFKALCTQFAADLISAAKDEYRSGRAKDRLGFDEVNSVDDDAKPKYFFFRAPSEFDICVHTHNDKYAFYWG